MKHAILFVSVLMLTLAAAAQVPAGVTVKTRFYLVRHAEKADNTSNPPLKNPEGLVRAGDLMRFLTFKKVKRIYVTEFLRTQMTADSMHLQLHIDTVHYKAEENGNDLFAKISAHSDFANKTILIVGHSNTVPDYIKKLGVINYPQADIPGSQFDNIYKVYYKRSFLWFGRLKAYVTAMKYGVPTP